MSKKLRVAGISWYNNNRVCAHIGGYNFIDFRQIIEMPKSSIRDVYRKAGFTLSCLRKNTEKAALYYC